MNFYDKYDFCEVMFKFLCGHVFSFLMIIYLCVETLSHIITLCLTIWGTAEIKYTVLKQNKMTLKAASNTL